MTTPSETNAELLSFAQQYQHSANQQAILDPFKEPLLLLRAKYASYEIITEELNRHDIKVSVGTVRKFCRRHHAEMKRLRAETEAERRASVERSRAMQPTASQATLPQEENNRPPLTPEIGKRGPRIARDEL